VADKLSAAAAAAGLTPEERKRIEDLSKTIANNRELSNLPAKVANEAFNNKTTAQQAALTNFAGTEPTPNRGWLSTAWHYTLGGAVNVLTELSDLSTRAYRAAAIPLSRGEIGFAWDEANDKGDLVFNKGRVEDARRKFGNPTVNVALKVAQGQKLSDIINNGTEEEKQVARTAQTGFKTQDGKVDGGIFQDALDAVNAAKYSPGRQLANLLLPGQLEGSGLLYRSISGFTDAAYRIIADPTLIAGKAKRLFDVSKYAVDVVVGGNKVDEVFAKPQVQAFWNQYGANLKKLKDATERGAADEMMQARNSLRTMAPEFGPAVVNSFLRADVPVENAITAKAFFANAKQVDEIFSGQIGRKRVLIPKLGNPLIPGTRAFRISVVTTANKVFNLDRIGPKFVDDLFFGGAATTDGIAEKLINGRKEIVEQVTANESSKGVARFSTAMIQRRLDRFKSKFERIPFFENNQFDVMSKDAQTKIYQLARLVLPQRESKLISEAFEAASGSGKRKEIFYGLQSTIAEIRGLNVTKEGKTIFDEITGRVKPMHAARNADGYNPSLLPNGESVGLILSDNSNFVSTISLRDLDRAASRSGLIQRMAGVGSSNWVEKMTSYWSFLTLAGPRYAIRNATEDLLVHLAIGESPWGLVKGRALSTRLRTARQVEKGLTGMQAVANTPLGSVLRFVNKKEAKAYGAAIEAAQGDVKQVREIIANALNEGKIVRLNERLGLGKFTKADRELLAEQIRFGDLDNALADVVEGGRQAFTGIDSYNRVINFTRKNKVRTAELTYTLPSNFRRARGGRFKEMMPTIADESTMVAWLMRIGYYSNDQLGAIAVANLADDAAGETAAVTKIFQWLDDPKNDNLVKAFRLEENGISKQEHAQRIYDAAKQLFVKRNGTLNKELLDKVRVIDDATGEFRISGNLSMDDLPKTDADLPEYLVGPSLVPVSDSDNYAASIMEWGWDWLGNANARFSREPMVLAEMVKIRKQFKSTGFEDAFIAAYKKGITDADGLAKAETAARRKLAEIAEDRARLQILAYVDNPAVQSQLAFGIRNFARFYRATEDFYRRFYRAVRYNPESLARAALTYEGITHSGWVQKDDQGEDYFLYPGVQQVYRAVQTAMQALGVPAEFKAPLPVEFGAKLKMITPSLSIDSVVPTLAGPLSGVSIKVVSNLVDIFSPGAADTITRVTLGKYAENQPMVSAFLPAHINRIYSAMNQNDRDGQYASAWRKAVTYLEASGHGLQQKYTTDEFGNEIPVPFTAEELDDYRRRVKNITMGILGLRVVYGFVAPASPQITLKSDMADWVRDNGEASFKQVWYGILDKTGDYDQAMSEWVRLFPDQMPFTVSESQRDTVAYFRYAQESGDFVNNNPELFKKHKQAAAFLIPHKGGFSWDAYRTMTDMGLRQNKQVDEFLREAQTAADMQTYYERKNKYEADLESVGTDFERQQLRAEWTNWATLFKAGRPLVQEELAEGGRKAVERLNALNDLKAMLDSGIADSAAPETVARLREMADLYFNYKRNAEKLALVSGGSTLAKWEKENTIIKMRELSQLNENTVNTYNLLFGRLLGD
jgi:hypothetical protein